MEMDANHEFKYRLYSLLKTLPVHKDQISYNGWFLCRCPFCGDSNKSQSHMHLGIGLNLDSYKAPGFKCMRCQEDGALTNNVLEMLGLYDGDIPTLIGRYRAVAAKKNIGFTGYEENVVPKLKLYAPILDIDNTIDKVKYIEHRLMLELTNEKIKKYRVVLNILPFLQGNNIKDFTRHNYTMSQINARYFGFNTVNKEFINCRLVIGKPDDYNKRWVNYNIFGITNNSKKFYTIEASPNIMRRQTIILAEGVFDIINIYEHMYKCDDADKIYGATLGTSYRQIIDFFIGKGILFFDLVIYSDADVNIKFYEKLKIDLGVRFNGKMTVHYNKDGKDYGERVEKKIRLMSYAIK